VRFRKLMQHASMAPITSPTFCVSSSTGRSETSVRLRQPELNNLVTDPLSAPGYNAFIYNPERSLVTSLHLKLNQLGLTTMSRQLDPLIVDVAAKNLGFAQPLETLADLELDSRSGRAIEPFPHVPSCMRSTPSTASTSSTTRAAWSPRTVFCACSIWSS
jgi:hypothetical protein